MFVLNGEALNGPPLSVVAAQADISASSNISAAALRTVTPIADISAGAATVLSAFQILQPSTGVGGTAYFSANVALNQAASTNATAGANLVAYVQRIVLASTLVQCGASMSVIVASTLGASVLSAGAQAVAAATRVQALIAPNCVGTASTIASARVIRNVAAEISASAATRTEATRNNLVDGFADITAGGKISIMEVGSTYRMATVDFVATAVVYAPAILIQVIQAAATASANLAVTAISQMIPFVQIKGCNANMTAEATRTVLPLANIEGKGTLDGALSQTFATASSLTASATVLPFVQLNGAIAASFSGSGSVSANGLAVRMAGADMTAGASSAPAKVMMIHGARSDNAAGASITTGSTTVQIGSAVVGGNASVALAPAITRFGAAALTPGADISAAGKATRMLSAEIKGSGNLYALGQGRLLARSAISCSATVLPESRTNADSFDSEANTLRRPFTDRLVRRPFTDRTLRRAA